MNISASCHRKRTRPEITCIVLSNQRLPVFESLPPPCIISWAILVSSYLWQCATSERKKEKSQITMQSFSVIQIASIDILPANQHDVHFRLLRQSLDHWMKLESTHPNKSARVLVQSIQYSVGWTHVPKVSVDHGPKRCVVRLIHLEAIRLTLMLHFYRTLK